MITAAAPIGHLTPCETTKAATIAWEGGAGTETSPTSGVYVTGINGGDYIKVRSVDFGSNKNKAKDKNKTKDRSKTGRDHE